VPPVLHAPLFAALFYGLLVALGFRLLCLMRVPIDSLTLWERGLVCAAIGGGTLQYLPLGLSVIGRASVGWIRAAVVVLTLLLLPDCWHIVKRLIAMARRPHDGLSREIVLWWSLLAMFAGIVLIRAVVVGGAGDDDGYHLMAPKRWLEAGRLIYLPTYTHTDAPVGFEMLYLIGLATSTVESAKLLHFGAGVLSLLGVGVLCLRLGGRGAALLAVALLCIPNRVYDMAFLFGLAYNDLAVCWMVISCLVIWLATRDRPVDGLLFCGALCAGFAGSFKFTALSVGAALALIVFWRAVGEGFRWSRAMSLTVKCGLLSVVPVLPWLWRNWLVTGNPLYPMFSGIVPTRDWSLEQARVFSLFFRYYNWGKASGNRLNLVQRQELLVGVTLCVLVAFVVAMVASRRRELREILVFSAVMIAMASGLTGLYFRFWLPAIACLAVCAGTAAAARWTERTLIWTATLFLAIGITIRMTAEWNDLPGHVRMATGRTSRDVEYRLDPMWTTWTYLNTQTPGGSRVLLASLYTTFGASSGAAFWVDRPTYVTDSHMQDYIHLNDWPSFLESIGRAAIDFVVISDTRFNAGRYGFTFTADTHEYPFCIRLVQEFGTLVNQYQHWQVYRLRPLPSTKTSIVPDVRIDSRPHERIDF
jgi:hypothetical protein